MAKRSSAQFQGDLGEIEIYRMLLAMGASINSLTASDTGWDLHVHLPKQKQDLPLVGPVQACSWPLSGQTIHIQVKRMSSQTWPTLNLGTVAGWLTGTRAGTPTFLFISDQSCTPARIIFASPLHLESWYKAITRGLAEETDLESSKHSVASIDFDDITNSDFARTLFLWAKYPLVMLYSLRIPDLDGLDDDDEEANNDDVATARGLIEEIATGYFSDHRISFYRDNPSEGMALVAQFIQSLPDAFSSDQREEIVLAVSSSILDDTNEKQEYTVTPGHGLSVANYSRTADPEVTKQRALELLEDLYSQEVTL